MDRFKRLYTKEDVESSEESRKKLIFGTISFMASLAFCAGKRPKDIVVEHKLPVEPTKLGFEELMIDGTVLHHVNRVEIAATMERVLKINLHSASNVKDMDHKLLDHHSDPYVVFSVDKSMSKSFVALHSTNPRWNTTHYLFLRKKPIVPKPSTKLRIDMFDCDKWVHRDSMSLEVMEHVDDRLALSYMDLNDLEPTGVHEKQIIYPRSGGFWTRRMSLRFSYQFLSINEFYKDIGKTDDSYWLDNFQIDNTTCDWETLYDKMEKGVIAMNPFVYIDSEPTSTQAWVFTNIEKKVLVVSFKGTDLCEHRDLLTDASVMAQPIQSIFSKDYVLKQKKTVFVKDCAVHHGFLTAYASVHENLLETIYSITDWSEDWLVVITGHSLGAALASLCAFEVSNRQLNGKTPQIGMLNFAAPRLAYGVFPLRFAQAVPASFRIRHHRDLVPIFPAHLWHVGNLVLAESGSRIEIVYPRSLAWLTLHHSAEDIKDEGSWMQMIPWHDHIRYHYQTAYFAALNEAMKKIFPGKFGSGKSQVQYTNVGLKGLDKGKESASTRLITSGESRTDKLRRVSWIVLICFLLIIGVPSIMSKVTSAQNY
eukprot:g2713.t1